MFFQSISNGCVLADYLGSKLASPKLSFYSIQVMFFFPPVQSSNSEVALTWQVRWGRERLWIEEAGHWVMAWHGQNACFHDGQLCSRFSSPVNLKRSFEIIFKVNHFIGWYYIVNRKDRCSCKSFIPSSHDTLNCWQFLWNFHALLWYIIPFNPIIFYDTLSLSIL